jgi:hypothetical protein
VKRYPEALGFTLKGEVCGCDLVALRGEEPPIVVIGEYKLAFSLELVLQGVDRTAACDKVWPAVRVAGRGGPSPARPTLSAPPSRPTVTPKDTRRRVSAICGRWSTSRRSTNLGEPKAIQVNLIDNRCV